MNKILRAEIWEVQIILYWILTLLLFHEKHPILGYIVLFWSIVSFIGTLVLLAQGKKEEKEGKYHL